MTGVHEMWIIGKQCRWRNSIGFINILSIYTTRILCICTNAAYRIAFTAYLHLQCVIIFSFNRIISSMWYNMITVRRSECERLNFRSSHRITSYRTAEPVTSVHQSRETANKKIILCSRSIQATSHRGTTHALTHTCTHHLVDINLNIRCVFK